MAAHVRLQHPAPGKRSHDAAGKHIVASPQAALTKGIAAVELPRSRRTIVIVTLRNRTLSPGGGAFC
jgi:hypothetical protein